jgi:hypothetical protein
MVVSSVVRQCDSKDEATNLSRGGVAKLCKRKGGGEMRDVDFGEAGNGANL